MKISTLLRQYRVAKLLNDLDSLESIRKQLVLAQVTPVGTSTTPGTTPVGAPTPEAPQPEEAKKEEAKDEEEKPKAKPKKEQADIDATKKEIISDLERLLAILVGIHSKVTPLLDQLEEHIKNNPDYEGELGQTLMQQLTHARFYIDGMVDAIKVTIEAFKNMSKDWSNDPLLEWLKDWVSGGDIANPLKRAIKYLEDKRKRDQALLAQYFKKYTGRLQWLDRYHMDYDSLAADVNKAFERLGYGASDIRRAVEDGDLEKVMQRITDMIDEDPDQAEKIMQSEEARVKAFTEILKRSSKGASILRNKTIFAQEAPKEGGGGTEFRPNVVILKAIDTIEDGIKGIDPIQVDIVEKIHSLMKTLAGKRGWEHVTEALVSVFGDNPAKAPFFNSIKNGFVRGGVVQLQKLAELFKGPGKPEPKETDEAEGTKKREAITRLQQVVYSIATQYKQLTDSTLSVFESVVNEVIAQKIITDKEAPGTRQYVTRLKQSSDKLTTEADKLAGGKLTLDTLKQLDRIGKEFMQQWTLEIGGLKTILQVKGFDKTDKNIKALEDLDEQAKKLFKGVEILARQGLGKTSQWAIRRLSRRRHVRRILGGV